jgi:hypothetical protein
MNQKRHNHEADMKAFELMLECPMVPVSITHVDGACVVTCENHSVVSTGTGYEINGEPVDLATAVSVLREAAR